ncbi:hypothetical protein [Kitasatospora sp. NPDC056181]|uniref:hypothetical protein n=1 Tax=Kitasatospora sp. NPDC056181 TaxID=3345737 RepID=UPI0035DB9F63
MQPVLELLAPPADFTLWEVGAHRPYDFLPLSGHTSAADVGTAVLQLALRNAYDPDDYEEEDGPTPPADPVDALLHGLLVKDHLFAHGGFRVTDTATGVTLTPGCCNGLEEWRDWLEVLDGAGSAGFGHDPMPTAERVGDTVRLVPDVGAPDGPAIELPAAELRRLVAGAERDLAAFLELADTWAAEHLPDHRAPLTAALARALDLTPEA